ncbi:MAG: HAMP domain-containing protein [Ardenticatenaceae bacterium]|nr:HAMP domain-containing protein [Ardenticatenaceae bacterium]
MMGLMRSLRVKLIFTFLATSITGILLAFMVVRQSNERAFADLLQEQRQAEFVQRALFYYQNTGSWVGFSQAFRSQETQPATQPAAQPLTQPVPGQLALPQPLFALADADGRIVLPAPPYNPNTNAPEDALTKGIPLYLDGVLIGTVLPVDQLLPRRTEEDAYVKQVNRALLWGAVAATAVAIFLAVIMARTLTRPLQELSAASRAMAQGSLEQQVPVRTQDELGELATTFNQMSSALALANQQRRQMTADIAHDLRTPLTVLSGYLEAMEDGTLSPTSARLGLMHQEVQALQRLVEDLRTLSLADAGKLTLQKELINPADLLAQVQASYAYQAAQQEVDLQVQAPVNLPATAVDPTRMRQVLGNLVSNALRYTPAGGVVTLAAASVRKAPPVAEHQPSLANDGLQITITDTGSGIPATDLPYIFDRFYRGDKSRQEGEGESGLGLAIVKSLVTAHGGAITAVSPPHPGATGTRFTITLPLA